MEVYFPQSGTNGKETIASIVIIGSFTSIPSVSLVDGSLIYDLDYISVSQYNDRIEAFVSIPSITGGESRFLDCVVTYNAVETTFNGVFAVTKYASMESLRSTFGIKDTEVDDFKLFNIISSTKGLVDSEISQYVKSGSGEWDIGSIPEPISLLHEYKVAKQIVELMYPDRVDKSKILSDNYDSLLGKIIKGQSYVEEIEPMTRFKVIGGD